MYNIQKIIQNLIGLSYYALNVWKLCQERAIATIEMESCVTHMGS